MLIKYRYFHVRHKHRTHPSRVLCKIVVDNNINGWLSRSKLFMSVPPLLSRFKARNLINDGAPVTIKHLGVFRIKTGQFLHRSNADSSTLGSLNSYGRSLRISYRLYGRCSSLSACRDGPCLAINAGVLCRSFETLVRMDRSEHSAQMQGRRCRFAFINIIDLTAVFVYAELAKAEFLVRCSLHFLHNSSIGIVNSWSMSWT